MINMLRFKAILCHLVVGLLVLLSSSTYAQRAAELTLNAGKLVEVNSFRVTDLTDEEFEEDYLPRLLSIYERYEFGAETKVLFEVTAKKGDGFFEQNGLKPPTYLLIVQWPDIDARRAALDDPDYANLEEQRQALVTSSESLFLTVENDIDTTLVNGRAYEFLAGVIDFNEIEDLQAFLGIILPGAETFGRVDLVGFAQSDVPDGNWNGNDAVSLVEFTSTGSFFRFTHTDKFLDALPLRENALTRLDIIVGEYDFKKNKRLKRRIRNIH